MKRAAIMIKEIAGGKINSEIFDIYPNRIEDFKINVSFNHIERLIGKDIGQDNIISILNNLDIQTTELDDEGFSVVHESSRSHFTWQGLRRLWRYDDVWLVEILKMQSVFFPPDQVREEVRDYILERCRAAGIRV